MDPLDIRELLRKEAVRAGMNHTELGKRILGSPSSLSNLFAGCQKISARQFFNAISVFKIDKCPAVLRVWIWAFIEERDRRILTLLQVAGWEPSEEDKQKTRARATSPKDAWG